MLYKIYTDGSSNQGSSAQEKRKGGWSYLILSSDTQIVCEYSQEEYEKPTNNQCEMLAVIYALKKVKELGLDGEIEVYSDSSYLVNAFEQNWFEKWEKTGWRNSLGEPVANRDLWEHLLKEVREKKVRLNRIKRNSDVFSKRVDFLSKQKMRS